MRKLDKKPIKQRGTGRKVKKSFFHLVTDLTRTDKKEYLENYSKYGREKILTKKQIYTALGVTKNQFYGIEKYFSDPKSKYAKKPTQKQLKILQQLAKKNKVETEQYSAPFFDRSKIENFGNVISKNTFESIKRRQKALGKNFGGCIIRIEIVIYTKQGTFTDYIAIPILINIDKQNIGFPNVFNVNSTIEANAGLLDSYENLTDFLDNRISQKIQSKNSIIGFQITNVQVDIATNDYEKNIKKPKAKIQPTKNIRKTINSKKSRKNKK